MAFARSATRPIASFRWPAVQPWRNQVATQPMPLRTAAGPMIQAATASAFSSAFWHVRSQNWRSSDSHGHGRSDRPHVSEAATLAISRFVCHNPVTQRQVAGVRENQAQVAHLMISCGRTGTNHHCFVALESTGQTKCRQTLATCHGHRPRATPPVCVCVQHARASQQAIFPASRIDNWFWRSLTNWTRKLRAWSHRKGTRAGPRANT
jgi:hypothetical protein